MKKLIFGFVALAFVLTLTPSLNAQTVATKTTQSQQVEKKQDCKTTCDNTKKTECTTEAKAECSKANTECTAEAKKDCKAVAKAECPKMAATETKKACCDKAVVAKK